MKLLRIKAPNFDLAKTLDSGQVFHWQAHGPGFVGTIGQRAVYVQQRGDELRAIGAPLSRIAQYFALDHDLEGICGSFPRDKVLDPAREFCRGLRIIRQPIWECLATFICSSMKQVAQIRQMSRGLRERFGTRRMMHGAEIYNFPSARRLAGASEGELRGCALGYRAKNLLVTAKLVGSGEAHLERWRSLADTELRQRLCELPGVGPKVANCVMLFAYERIVAFPIDVWIGRVLRESYFPGKGAVAPKALAEFAARYFGPHGGYAQQYLFHRARMSRHTAAERARTG